MPPPSNGKTSLVHYRTHSFFAFRLKKKWKFAFFLISSTKSLSNLFASLRYWQSFKINQFASLPFASLRFANLIFCNKYGRFASLDLQFNINYLRFASIFKFFNINMFTSLRNKSQTIERVRLASIFKFFNINMFASLRNKFSNYWTYSLRFDF